MSINIVTVTVTLTVTLPVTLTVTVRSSSRGALSCSPLWNEQRKHFWDCSSFQRSLNTPTVQASKGAYLKHFRGTWTLKKKESCDQSWLIWVLCSCFHAYRSWSDASICAIQIQELQRNRSLKPVGDIVPLACAYCSTLTIASYWGHSTFALCPFSANLHFVTSARKWRLVLDSVAEIGFLCL